MLKIKTITCHDVYNHGASLQAYALQRYLSERGYEVEIIDYKPWYLSNHYNFRAINNSKYDYFLIRSLYKLAKLPSRLISLKRKFAFDRFRKEQLRLTSKCYASNDQLKADCPEADVYIAGSDQIWNTLFENGKDPAFYLDFVTVDKKRLSYAASFATEKIVNGYEDFVKEKVEALDFISVREQQGVELLRKLEVNNAVQVVDPVFLLTQHQWNDFASFTYIEKYLLVYDTEKSETLKQISITLAKKLNLKIFSVGSLPLSYANRNFHQTGPVEFVSLIKNAEYVISNSFHGTAFSLIFHKNFCVINRSEAINSRMLSLLQSLGIENRLIGSSVNIEEIIKLINFKQVQAKLDELIDHSKMFLTQSIEG